MVQPGNNCFGCTACVGVYPTSAILMKPNKEGFQIAHVDQNKCINCGICNSVCQIESKIISQSKPKYYGAKNTTLEVRKKSTSGGVFTALSEHIFSLDGVVYGCIYEGDPLHVCFVRAEDSCIRDMMRGSKYIEGVLGNIFLSVEVDLVNGRDVLFVGTPCQVVGLKQYLISKKVNSDKLLLCDFLCHGVMSPTVFGSYIKLLEKKTQGRIISYSFRNTEIWKDNSEVPTFSDSLKHDYDPYITRTHRILFDYFYSGKELCTRCPYRTQERYSDITLADFWGIEKINPDFEDKYGVSLISINTVFGQEVFDKISSRLALFEVAFDAFDKRKFELQTKLPENRAEFWQDYENKGIEYVLKKYCRYSVKWKIYYKLTDMLRIIGVMKYIKNVREGG